MKGGNGKSWEFCDLDLEFWINSGSILFFKHVPQNFISIVIELEFSESD